MSSGPARLNRQNQYDADSEERVRMPRISGLAEIVLHVRNREASLSFYRDLLGLTVISPPDFPGPVFLKAGDGAEKIPQMVVLVSLPDDAPAFQPPSHLHHLALEVSPEDFDAFHSQFNAAGIEVRSGQHPVIPSRTIYIDDPDGNEVELICRDQV
jgi:catechol 2,3-dioxygenase-like lactoylglutathione lyase family enzyme